MKLDNPTIIGYATADSGFKVTGGTSTQFLKADGSKDSTSYSVTTHNHSGAYEPVITAGTTSQYWRGDKTWQPLPSGITLTSLSATSPILYNNVTGVFSHASTNGYNHIPANGSSGQILRWASTGVATWGAENGSSTNYYLSGLGYTSSTSILLATMSGGASNVSLDLSNLIYADALAVTGNGTTDQYLRSDGDGTFTWDTPPNAAVTVNTSASASYFDVLWHSGDNLYSSTGSKLTIQASTGNLISLGNMTAVDFIGTSDISKKENIKELFPKELLTAYKTFNFIGSSENRVGLIAQELEVSHPEFVRIDDDGIKSISYIDVHSAEIAYLKAKNQDLEERIERLEGLLETMLKNK
jgi:hypothetical protein